MTDSVAETPIRVLTVDDHPVLREGIASIIAPETDIVLAGEAENGEDAVRTFRALRPDVTLMDLQMPVMDGVQAIFAIRAISPSAKIIVLTTYAKDAQAVRAIKAGATGYLLKSALRNELLEAIRSVYLGQRSIPHELAGEIAFQMAGDALSDREMDVLRLVAVGEANKRIAWKLAISEDTVKAHLKSIFVKLDVADRTHAVTVAARRGIIDL